MGSCGASKRRINVTEPSLTRKISINPSQFISQSYNRFSHSYRIGNKIGGGNFVYNKGAYGEVYECYQRESGLPRAVKVIQRDEIGSQDEQRFLREIEILKIMDHPNIVKLYETYSDTKRLYLVME